MGDSAEQRERRQKAIDFARGSVRLEGFTLSPEAEKLGVRFIIGDLTLPQYIDAILAISKAGPGHRAWDEGQITAMRIAELELNPVGRPPSEV
jgi:hypothetical protein